MRIVSGSHKGRMFYPPGFFKDRPTTDMAKESLFNILNNIVDYTESDVLDLFAGTGSISYEFASRGSRSVVAVEKNPKYVYFIKKTIEDLKLPQITALTADSFKFLSKTTHKYDIIFADPPYTDPEIVKIPSLVFANQVLKKEGLLIIEHSKSIDFAKYPEFKERRNYGKVNFSFLAF